jgi:hypothetical protein
MLRLSRTLRNELALNVFGEEFADSAISEVLKRAGMTGSFWISQWLAEEVGWPEPRKQGLSMVRIGPSSFKLFNNYESFDFDDELYAQIALILNAHRRLDHTDTSVPRALSGSMFNFSTTACLGAVQCLRGYSSRIWLSERQVEMFGTSVTPRERAWACYERGSANRALKRTHASDGVELLPLYNASQTANPDLFSDHHFRPVSHVYFSGPSIPLVWQEAVNDFCAAKQLKMRIPCWGTRADFADHHYEVSADTTGIMVPDEFNEDFVELFNPEQLQDREKAIDLARKVYESVIPCIPPNFLVQFDRRKKVPSTAAVLGHNQQAAASTYNTGLRVKI